MPVIRKVTDEQIVEAWAETPSAPELSRRFRLAESGIRRRIRALGPIIRGDHKKRSRNSQIDLGYDTLLLGHWHQLIMLQRLIVNGSLKGYDEYAALKGLQTVKEQCDPIPGGCYIVPAPVLQELVAAAGKQI